MNRSMREQLLGYLLDALDDVERQEVDQRLAEDAQWQAELEQLRCEIEPLEGLHVEWEPPCDLAERTCQLISQYADAVEAAAPQLTRCSPGLPIPPSSASWSMADLVVAIGVCVVAALLFFPAISNSRYMSQLLACQNNLRQIGIAMADYSDKAGNGYYPAVAARGNRAYAGVYAPILLDGGYVKDLRVFVCPTFPLPDDGAVSRIPTLWEIDVASSNQVIALQSQAVGLYGYNLGVVVDGKHSPPRNLGRGYFALMSDAPVLPGPPHFNTQLHWGRGLNLLYEDGHISFCEPHSHYVDRDDPFRNRRGIVEAGLDENDAVIGQGLSPPFQRVSLGGQPQSY